MTETTTALNVPDILRKTADLIEEHGWTQNQNRSNPDGTGGFCLGAAVAYILSGGRISNWSFYTIAADASAMYDRWFTVLTYLTGRLDGRWAICWNDDPDRTKGEVLAFIRLAADTYPETAQ